MVQNLSIPFILLLDFPALFCNPMCDKALLLEHRPFRHVGNIHCIPIFRTKCFSFCINSSAITTHLKYLDFARFDIDGESIDFHLLVMTLALHLLLCCASYPRAGEVHMREVRIFTLRMCVPCVGYLIIVIKI